MTGALAPDAVVHPPLASRRAAGSATTWWGKAWVRSVQEAAYTETDARSARRLARSGGVGGITVTRGAFVASVSDGEGLWTARCTIPEFDPGAVAALVEVVAAQSGRVGALLGGDLPHSLVEHADEAGAELLPYGTELDATCTCEAWLDPCPHALAVMYTLTRLIEHDPTVLLHLRGLAREDLLGQLHERATAVPVAGADEGHDDAVGAALDTAADAVLRAARILDLLDDPDARLDHLF